MATSEAIGMTESPVDLGSTLPPATDETLRSVYEEVCNSYHSIDDFRMKLLGILPLTSVVGVVAIEKGPVVAAGGTNELLAYASFFAAAFTLALFIYEIRGIRRSHRLVERGQELEDALRAHGQFWVCAFEADARELNTERGRRIARVFNSTVAACVMYSLVFSSWLFLAIRYGFGWEIHTCALFALAFGVAIAAGVHSLVRPLIPA